MDNMISDTELSILQHLWCQDEPQTFAQILTHFNEIARKDWKKQTLNTFLLRLKNKGFLRADTTGPKCVYIPTVSSEEYRHRYARQVVEKSFDSSLMSFFCAFTGDKKISSAERDELMDYLKGL